MNYFDYFPKLRYKFPNGVSVEMMDIFRNVKIKRLLDKPELFEYYALTDGERPEGIANKYYEEPSLYWLVLMANGIEDVNMEWPRFTEDEDRTLTNQYSGYAFFFNEEMKLQKGDIIAKYDVSSDGSVSGDYGVVYSHDFSLNKTEVRNHNFTTSTITTGTSSLNTYYVFRETGNGQFITLGNELTPKRIENLKDAVLYFRHKDGYVLSPSLKFVNAASFSNLDVNLFPTNNQKASVNTVLQKYLNGRVDLLTDADISIVTLQSQLDENASNTIRLIRKEFVGSIVGEISRLLSEGGSQSSIVSLSSGGLGGYG